MSRAAIITVVAVASLSCNVNYFPDDYPSGLLCSSAGTCPPGQVCVPWEKRCRQPCTMRGPNVCQNGGPCECSTNGSQATCDVDFFCRPICGNNGPGNQQCGGNGPSCPNQETCDSDYNVCRPLCQSGCIVGTMCTHIASNSCSFCRPTVNAMSSCVDAGAGPVVLAINQNGPLGVAADGINVYWTNHGDGSVMKCAACGCGQSPTPVMGTQLGAYAIVTDGNNVYWTTETGNTVLSCSVSGCGSPFQVASGQGRPLGLAIAAVNPGSSWLFWTNNANGAVIECPGGNCQGNPMWVNNQAMPYGIASDGQYVYWTNIGDNTLKRCLATNCQNNPSLFAAAKPTTPLGIAADAANVYWTNSDGTVLKCPVNGCNATGSPLAAGQGTPFAIVTDAVNVYWTNNKDGTVAKCAVGGCGGKPTVLAMGQNAPSGIAVDGSNVYWATGDGTIVKLAK
jgi:hypothetical protein